MRDCVNAEVRDRLPELVHGRIDEPERSAVEAHVAECPDCAAEAALIRLVVGSVALATPRVDVGRVAAALPAPAPLLHVVPRQRWSGRTLRWAAAFIVAIAGLGTLQYVGTGGDRQEVASATRTLPATGGSQAVARPVAGVQAGGSGGGGATAPRYGLVLVGGIDALSLDQLEVLVSGVETLSEVPAFGPEPALMYPTEDGR
jgi:anti-sigma factor RsiW